ncbi:MAG: YitT family protein [Bacteroidetes bacterium]|nr:YitT family protein [Bacteroidota bacterium]
MLSFWKQILIRAIKLDNPNRKITIGSGFQVSNYLLAKSYREFKISLVRLLKDVFLITAGIFSAAFGFKGFLLSNHFIDGGATGISLLLAQLINLPLFVFIILVNIPFIILGYKVLGKSFAIKTSLAIILLSIVLVFVQFPDVTHDNLLIAVFGGFFLGAGIGLAIRGGAVIDGTEVLAIFISRKIGASIGDIVLVFNVIIFSVAAYLLGVEIALYSMITYLAASKTLDFIVEGIEEYVGVTIISTHSKEIKDMIVNNMKHGVTVYNGKGGYGKTGEAQSREILYTVVTRIEFSKLKTELEKIEPNIFMVTHSVKDIRGGIVKKRPLKH